MVDISDSKLKQLLGKSWGNWNLPLTASEEDSTKLREVFRPKDFDGMGEGCNLLPETLWHLYGTYPEVEWFSIMKCPACKNIFMSRWFSKHFKLDSCDNFVCWRTEMIVIGNKVLGTAVKPLYDMRESTRDPLSDESESTSNSSTRSSWDNFTYPLSPRHHHKQSSTKTEPVVSPSPSKSKSSSSSSSSSTHHSSKKHHSSSSSSLNSVVNKHKSSSSSSSKSLPTSSSSWSSSRRESSRSHKSHHGSSGSYVLSIPSDDSSNHSDSVESILMSSSKQAHIATAKSSRSSPEYEQIKFYADASEKRTKVADVKGHRIHFSAHLENFKIPLKSKSSSSHTSTSDKKSKSSSTSTSSHHTHSSSKSSGHETSRMSVRYSTASSSHSISKPVPSLTIISEPLNTPLLAPPVPSLLDVKEKSSSHSKKKKKKKSKDEPRKVIPLKERAFNPNLHCGVTVTDGGHPCTRSLTCKTHSIALRRAVPGRSHPFDSLLAAHKKARDEEKAKTSAIKDIEDSKSKSKKLHSSTPVPPDSDSNSNSLPPPPIVTKGSSSSSAKSFGVSMSAVAASVAATLNGKHHSGSANASSKVANLPLNSQKQSTSKAGPTVKAVSRPVIIVEEEKKETASGLSLFSLRREPENSFVYLGEIHLGKSIGKTKGSCIRNTRSNALSEWNPLDRFSRKGSGSKKKGFKDPLVSLLPSKVELLSVLDNSVSVGIVSGEAVPDAGARALGRTGDSAKRKTSAASSDSVSGGKKPRVLSCPNKFYESLLGKSTRRRAGSSKAMTTRSGGSPEKVRSLDSLADEKMAVVKTAVELIQSQLQELEGSPHEDDGRSSAELIQDRLSPEGREFLRNCVKAHSDKKESVDKMSANEMFQHAFELTSANRCILS